MLRLLFLSTLTAISAASMGCAGRASVLTRSSEGEPAPATDQAPEHLSSRKSQQPEKSHSAARKEGLSPSATPETDAAERAAMEPPHAKPVDSRAATPTLPTPDRLTGADPLLEMVQQIGFDDPTEEAGALAALQAAPIAHRDSLLRTLKASAALRKRQVETTAPALADTTAAGKPETPFASGEPIGESVSTRRRPTVTALASSPRRVERPGKSPIPPTIDSQIPSEAKTSAPTADRTVIQAAHSQPVHDSGWRWHLDQAIEAMEREGPSGAKDPARSEARLRLLYLIAGRRDDALRPAAGAAVKEDEFWTKEIYGLSILLNDEGETNRAVRDRLATHPLREAADLLGQSSGLVIKNLQFCSEVKGFGSFVKFEKDEFRRGQELLLYCEAEDFHSKSTQRGYHTALKARYEIFNAQGTRVADRDLGLKDEHCENRRRDFFVPYFLWLPKQIAPGNYQLKLTVEDVHGATTADASIGFAIQER